MNEYGGVEIRSNDERFFEKLITHPKIIEAYEERNKTQWNMANGSTINFSEIGRIDDISYFPNKDYVIIDELSKYPTKFLTQPEKKANIAPSTLLVKLIGRVAE